MKISYSYRNYKDNEEATKWSRIAAKVQAMSCPIILITWVAFYKMLPAHPILSLVLGLVVGLAIAVGSIRYCRRKETECVVNKVVKDMAGNNLSDEEKKRLIVEALKNRSNK